MMASRLLLTGLLPAVLLTATLAAQAQAPPGEGASRLVEPLLQTLRELGHEEGRNIAIESRWAEGRNAGLAGPP
jgi:hypothetical protein